MVERLTERSKIGTAFFNDDGALIRGAGGAFRQKKDMTANFIHQRFVALDKAIDRLAAYEDAMPLERAQELSQAEKDGRLVVLPCKDDTVFTIEEDFFNCDQCKHKANARYQPDIGRISCDLVNSEHCPLRVEEHKVEGFEISFKEGDPVVSLPGAYGYEGLETYSGFDGKCYYTREEAEAALKEREED